MQREEFLGKKVTCPLCNGEHELRENKRENPMLECSEYGYYLNFNTAKQQEFVRERLLSKPQEVPQETPEPAEVHEEKDPFDIEGI